MLCLYCNGIVGAFAHILNPSIQADIRDYQQYKTGERIDGMFAAVATIGSVITLVTSGAIPALQERLGMNVENARRVVNDANLMSRVLPGANETIGQMLAKQAANGQDIFNASNALYDVDGVLIPLLRVLILVAAAVPCSMLFLSSFMISQSVSKKPLSAFLKFALCLRIMQTRLFRTESLLRLLIL